MSAVALQGDLQAELDDARAMISKMAALNSAGRLLNHEFDVAVNAVCLATHVAFERFIRELFFQCLSGDSGISHVKSRISSLQGSELNQIVLGERPFVDWLPVARTMERAQTYLVQGQPFVRLWSRDLILAHLDRLHTVRNRLAHSGEKAEKEYAKKIARGQAAFAEPARWLIDKPGGGPASNLEMILTAMTDAADALVSADRTPTNLGPAKVEGNQRVMPGKYRCTNCRRVAFIAASESIGPCPRCAVSSVCSHCGHRKEARSTWDLEQLKAN